MNLNAGSASAAFGGAELEPEEAAGVYVVEGEGTPDGATGVAPAGAMLDGGVEGDGVTTEGAVGMSLAVVLILASLSEAKEAKRGDVLRPTMTARSTITCAITIEVETGASLAERVVGLRWRFVSARGRDEAGDVVEALGSSGSMRFSRVVVTVSGVVSGAECSPLIDPDVEEEEVIIDRGAVRCSGASYTHGAK